jgi:hypothetical protein
MHEPCEVYALSKAAQEKNGKNNRAVIPAAAALPSA